MYSLADAQFSAVWEICPIISSSGRLVHILWLSKERWISPISLKWDSAKALRSCYCLNWVSWAHPSFPKSYALIKHWKNYRIRWLKKSKMFRHLTKADFFYETIQKKDSERCMFIVYYDTMIWNNSKWVSMCLKNRLFQIIWSHFRSFGVI